MGKKLYLKTSAKMQQRILYYPFLIILFIFRNSSQKKLSNIYKPELAKLANVQCYHSISACVTEGVLINILNYIDQA